MTNCRLHFHVFFFISSKITKKYVSGTGVSIRPRNDQYFVLVPRTMNYIQRSDGLYGKSKARLQPLVHGPHHDQSRSSGAQLVHQHFNILLAQLKIQGRVPRASEKAKVGRIVCGLSIALSSPICILTLKQLTLHTHSCGN